MKIAVLAERAEGETRVAVSPETVGKLKALGADVVIEAGAGARSRFTDEAFAAAGAEMLADRVAVVAGAEVVLGVRRPEAAALAGAAPGALVIGAMDPYGNEPAIKALADAGVTAIAMEFMPRITRAQVMDILSSQANLAGYQGVIEAAAAFGRAFPMMMTAAGTVRPAKVFVMGAGVAGLQAIATARRLGGVVTANDVRPAAKEQVESLGGKFIAVEDDEFRQAETSGGYAKEMSAEYKQKQAALTASHIAKQDIVITTALIPGRPAPRLISAQMVETMAPGSVIVDLAAERGGNCELTVPGEIIEHRGVTIIGHRNFPGRLPTSASQLYARNLLAFLETLIGKETRALAVNWDDELVKATVLTRDGAIVHPNIRLEPAPMPTEVPAMADTPRPPEAAVIEERPAEASTASTTEAAPAPAAIAKPRARKAATPKTAAPKTDASKIAAPKTAASKTAAPKTAASRTRAAATRADATKPAAAGAKAKPARPAKTGAAAKPRVPRKPETPRDDQ
ncbi:Re/Si-specific NAD(P)(+) transhydrogenase subunit alpha [Arsenicitalea aurantiaca]|uniref:NAD(P) transhydrogenase subunit alpha part 1 n=2 Tax=Arsenicitalea aurantiaca TaxID=1783274 RepID=A0A433XKL5_9HYPH|nr:Re/Si-specific NAD(P)(+) transhydrogenase subunit alpha [Arsenicitalea aurantiaca]RUT34616.1 Re/Si-specific NAD(P)(+) transhydrogenase subunit alpha [Arsenicitalea aurantiaca]